MTSVTGSRVTALYSRRARPDKAVVMGGYLPAPRGPHTWRLRRIGLRGRLVANGWGIRGPYAEKVINGRRVLVKTIGEQADWVVCRFERRAT